MSTDGRIEARFSVPAGQTVTATNSIGGPITVNLTPGAYYLPQFLAQLVTDLNAQAPSGWSGSLSTGASGTLQVTINCTATPWSLVWSSTTTRDLLGFTADILTSVTAQTGTKQARGLWMADCPLTCDDDPRQAPLCSDLRTTTGPTGIVLGLTGNVFYRHSHVKWGAVSIARKRELSALLSNASWETFFAETQLGRGLSWFTPASKVRIYDHTGTLLGSDANSGAGVDGWWMTGLTSIEPRRLDANWLGLWVIEIPILLSSG